MKSATRGCVECNQGLQYISMNYFSMCSGIEGFGEGIQQAYEDYAHKQIGQPINQGFKCGTSCRCKSQLPTCVGFSEIDKYAAAIVKYHYPNRTNFGDATKIDTGSLPDFDLLCAGFPCQAFSIAGKRQGFADIRGTIFFEVARILDNKRPSHFLLENVRGLSSHDEGKTLQRILEVLSELGYYVETTVLNSKDYGVPQNRERMYFIGHFAERCGNEILSFGNGYQEIIQKSEQRNLSGTISTKNQSGQCNFDRSTTLVMADSGQKRSIDIREDMPPLRTGGDVPIIIQRARGYNEGGEFETCPTLSSNSWQENNHLSIENRIRRLTPIECERLQGFPDDWTKYGLFENGEITEISNTQRYKTCGNAVTTFVPEAIIYQMLEVGCLT